MRNTFPCMVTYNIFNVRPNKYLLKDLNDFFKQFSCCILQEEGNSGGGPDSGSSVSSSSTVSSMKFIATKLKPQGRTRLIVLALIVVIFVIVVAAIATAVYFTNDNQKGAQQCSIIYLFKRFISPLLGVKLSVVS